MTLSEHASLAVLDQLLATEIALVRELQPLVQAKQQALVAGDLAQIQAVADRELCLGGQLARLEDERHQAAQHLAVGLKGIRTDHPLSELLQFLPDDATCASVRQRAAVLQDEVTALAMINADNQHLAHNLLNYARMVLRLVTEGEMQPAYTAAGQVAEGALRRPMVDNRI